MDETTLMLGKPSSQAVPMTLPRRVIRHLLSHYGIGVGTRILDVGCGTGGLVRYLEFLGADAVGFDESAQKIAEARKLTCARAEFFCGDSVYAVPFSEARFDVIIVRQQAVYDGDMFSLPSFRATGNLLASLRPHGYFVFLNRVEQDSVDRICGHQIACFARHLSYFPGSCRVNRLPDGLTNRSTWQRLIRRQPRAAYQTASIRIPLESQHRAEWRRLAEIAAACDSSVCCEWAAQSRNHLSVEKRAA